MTGASGRLHALSLRAIRLAAAHPSEQPADLARVLYAFGRIPVALSAERDFGLGDDPMLVLDLASGGPTRELLEAGYESITHPGWYSFYRRNGRDRGLRVKLYVSPHPEALAASFPQVARLFARFKVPSFKVGRGLSGLFRPDKIVAYFDDHDSMAEVAAAIAAALKAREVQGVPFTAELGGGRGIVSWGTDPAADAGEGPKSWRSVICAHLADAVLEARRTGAEPVAHALGHLQARGIDCWRTAAP